MTRWVHRHLPRSAAACARVVGARQRIAGPSYGLPGQATLESGEGARRSRLRAPERVRSAAPANLLALDGEDLRRRPLLERRAILADLIGPFDPESPLHFSQHVEGRDGPSLFQAIERRLGEWIVSKAAHSRYISDRRENVRFSPQGRESGRCFTY